MSIQIQHYRNAQLIRIVTAIYAKEMSFRKPVQKIFSLVVLTAHSTTHMQRDKPAET